MRSRALIDSVYDWTPAREESVMVGTSWDSVRALLSYVCNVLHNQELNANEGVQTLKTERDGG